MADERFAWAIKSPTGGYNAIETVSRSSLLRKWMNAPPDASDSQLQALWDMRYGLLGWEIVKVRLVEEEAGR